MSLLDHGPHEVDVWMEIETTDARGNLVRRPADQPVRVRRVHMLPLASTRGAFAAIDVKTGQGVNASHKLICREAPVGWWSRVRWVDRRGVEHNFSVLGGPQWHDSSSTTRHLTVTLKEER